MKTKAMLCGFLLLQACSSKSDKLPASADTIRLVQSPGDIAGLDLTYEQRQGRYLYMKYCSVCHGVEGKGDGFNAYNLDPKPRDFTDGRFMRELTDARLFETISRGGRGMNKSVLMPSWGGTLTEIQRTYVVAYIRQFAAKKP